MGTRIRFLALAVLVLGAAASAGYEETEFRLKQAGVAPALRKRIHTAIDRGVLFLLSVQRKDGTWASAGTSWRRPGSAESVYAALALRHAGTRPALRGVRLALTFLVPEGSRGLREVKDHVYVAGPMAMLLWADRSHEDLRAELAGRFAGSQLKDAWWGYTTQTRFTGGGIAPRGREKLLLENLSTSQFAALGLWAAGRDQPNRARTVWRNHLESLVRLQMRSGSWRYAPKPPFDGGGYGYYTGTFMGFANLLLAEVGAELDPKRPPRYAADLPEANRRALSALERDAPAFLQLLACGESSVGWPYYGLYALEKAAIFVDREMLGHVRWYVDGATLLCERQEKDGSWQRRDVIQTAFALLFLLRSSSVYHPTTPRDVAHPEAPVSGTAQPKKAPVGPDSQKPVTLDDAQGLLDALEKKLHARRSADLPEPDEVRALADADATVIGDAKQVAEWRKRWTALLWKVLAAPARGRPETRARWDAIQVAAAEALSARGRADAKSWRALLERGPFKNRKWEPTRAWWRATLEVMFPAVATPEGAEWLADELARPALHDLDRVEATLVGLRLAAPKLPKKTRRELIDLLVRRFEGKEDEFDKRPPGSREELEWDTIGAHVLTTLRALGRDPDTGAYPLDEQGRALTSLEAFRTWLRR